MSDFILQRKDNCWQGSFNAMASPCEVLMEVDDEILARKILVAVAEEAWRIEQKFSRYRDFNIIDRINRAEGKPVVVDDETIRLLNFANELHQLSEGLFDITSGALRRVWTFDGSDKLPDAKNVQAVLDYIGWQKVSWEPPNLILPAGMEIDLGGIGKEYAVDSCVQIARELTGESVLINFGGDLAVTNKRRFDGVWSVGRLITGKQHAVSLFELKTGAIATSGDAHRYLMKDGVRYSHVLDPRNGWPVTDAPHTVSIAAPTCVEAGMLSTMAMLHGAKAKEFLEKQEVNFWID